MIDVIRTFGWRFRLAVLAFKQASNLTPVITLKNGTKVDLESKQIIFEGDTNLHCTGNLTISADKHLMLDTSKLPEEREGYVYSVWFNSDKDNSNRPIRYVEVQNIEHGNIIRIPYRLVNGKLDIPEGFKRME